MAVEIALASGKMSFAHLYNTESAVQFVINNVDNWRRCKDGWIGDYVYRRSNEKEADLSGEGLACFRLRQSYLYEFRPSKWRPTIAHLKRHEPTPWQFLTPLYEKLLLRQ